MNVLKPKSTGLRERLNPPNKTEYPLTVIRDFRITGSLFFVPKNDKERINDKANRNINKADSAPKA